jgi:hypothetical protein
VIFTEEAEYGDGKEVANVTSTFITDVEIDEDGCKDYLSIEFRSSSINISSRCDCLKGNKYS